MPLTPTDVANKQFRIAFRGYSLDEVDAFLDEVETELSRLLRDNASLRDRSETAGAAQGATPATAPSTPAAPAAPPLSGMEGQEAALRTLLLAQRTADEAIAEARAEAEQIVSAARAEAESTLTSARSEAETTLTSARSEAKTTLEQARSEASSTLATSKDKAARIDEEVAARIHAATGDLDARRRTLEVRIEELRAFEREYRTRLKAYLEGQLRDLDSRSGPDEGSVGVPAGARTAAVGGRPASGPRTDASQAPAAPAPQGAPALRAVPPAAPGGPAPVGPFTQVPPAGPAGDEPAGGR